MDINQILRNVENKYIFFLCTVDFQKKKQHTVFKFIESSRDKILEITESTSFIRVSCFLLESVFHYRY